MTTKTIITGKDTGRDATLKGDMITIAKGSHRMSTDKVKQYKTEASARRQFNVLTTAPEPTPGRDTITLKISDINAEIDNIGDNTTEYQRGRKSLLISLLWRDTINRVERD